MFRWQENIKMDLKGPINPDVGSDMNHNADYNMYVDT
jgi:hypothetical protein